MCIVGHDSECMSIFMMMEKLLNMAFASVISSCTALDNVMDSSSLVKRITMGICVVHCSYMIRMFISRSCMVIVP